MTECNFPQNKFLAYVIPTQEDGTISAKEGKTQELLILLSRMGHTTLQMFHIFG